jgi:AcrR family transcriptional regulator
VASAADANKRAIYDYFGDKHGLFAAVLERQMIECAESVPIDGADLAGYAEQLFDYHAAHPESLRLLLWEALEFGGREVPAEATRTRKYQKRVDAVASAQNAGGKISAGKPAPDPRALVFFTLGLVNWASAAPQLRRMLLGEDFSPEQMRTAVADAVRILSSG